MSTSRSCRPQRRGLLEQPVALALALRSMLNAPRWSRSSTATTAASPTGGRARSRAAARPRQRAGRQPGQRVAQRERSHAPAQARVLDRDRGLGGEQRSRRRSRRAAPPRGSRQTRIITPATALAHDRLEQRRARAGRVHQRLGERRVLAGVGDEVALQRRERLGGGRCGSARGWIVTGAMSMPNIAVETNSRPDGSSRKATGAPVASQAARAPRPCGRRPRRSARCATRPSAASPRACSRSESLTGAGRAGRSRARARRRARGRASPNSCSSSAPKRRGAGARAASTPTRAPSESSSGMPT